jgi:hypothetical protein
MRLPRRGKVSCHLLRPARGRVCLVSGPGRLSSLMISRAIALISFAPRIWLPDGESRNNCLAHRSFCSGSSGSVTRSVTGTR